MPSSLAAFTSIAGLTGPVDWRSGRSAKGILFLVPACVPSLCVTHRRSLTARLGCLRCLSAVRIRADRARPVPAQASVPPETPQAVPLRSLFASAGPGRAPGGEVAPDRGVAPHPRPVLPDVVENYPGAAIPCP